MLISPSSPEMPKTDVCLEWGREEKKKGKFSKGVPVSLLCLVAGNK